MELDRLPPAEQRASHADRDRVVDLLRVAAGDGRLTPDELDERLEKALTARTVGDLAVLTRDLAGRDVLRVEREGGNFRRHGRWHVPRLIEVRVGPGHVVLDFTEAVITQPVLRIEADVRSGTLTLLTGRGIEVDADEVAVQSSGSVRVRPPRGPRRPAVLRIEVVGTVQSGHLRAHPRRRWLGRSRRGLSRSV